MIRENNRKIMRNILIIYAHPGPAGQHAYFLDKVKQLLEEKRSADLNYEVLDLYTLNYEPRLKNSELYTANNREIGIDTEKIQEKIKESDSLLFIYPTWWQNMPAILKGFLDRTFVSGFAYRYEGHLPVGLLKGKKAAAFTATGQPRWFNFLIKRDRSLKVLLTDVLGFSGMETKGFSLGNSRALTDERKAALKKKAICVVKYLLK